VAQIAQFAGIDGRTAGKLLKNSQTIGLVECIDGTGYTLSVAYPYKGTDQQKRDVVREALVNLPLLASVRQFLNLHDSLEVALRKAATIAGIRDLDPANLTPLIKWANQLEALKPGLVHDDLLESAEAAKKQRHRTDKTKRVAFLSHSSVDKPFIRQLATDLTAAGISVWLDEQKIRVGDSIPDQIAQGLAESDFFVVALSRQSSASEWVKHELNTALVSAITERRVKVLPAKLDDVEMPLSLGGTLYADFSKSYKDGLRALLDAMKDKPDVEQ
jgi:TIR domain